jgi:hypothetical protein
MEEEEEEEEEEGEEEKKKKEKKKEKKTKKKKKKLYLVQNLEQMFKRTTTDLNTQPKTQQSVTRAQKCQVAAASTIRSIRSTSESIGNV